MIVCSCGRVHTDASKLAKVGWQDLGEGEWALLVNCTCRSTICAEVRRDGAQCIACARFVVGDSADPHVATPEGVMCQGCARRSGQLGRRAA